MKNIKDYLHLYTGCELDGWVTLTPRKLQELLDDERDNVLLLRKLSDINLAEFARTSFYDPDAIVRGNANAQHERFVKNRINKVDILYNSQDIIFLIQQGFDLFGLIEAGLAIDKTKLKHP